MSEKIGITIGEICFLFILSFFTMLLWNWLMPELFKLATVTYWQACGLTGLSSILFKRHPKMD